MDKETKDAFKTLDKSLQGINDQLTEIRTDILRIEKNLSEHYKAIDQHSRDIKMLKQSC